MTEVLVIRAFAKAVASGNVECRSIIHADQGSQYVSNNFRSLLQTHRCRQSMSRRGNCYDNAEAESVFSRYKAELLEGSTFSDVSQARSETFSYIEGYYNQVRRHSALGYKSPDEFEREINHNMKGEGQRAGWVLINLTLSVFAGFLFDASPSMKGFYKDVIEGHRAMLKKLQN